MSEMWAVHSPSTPSVFPAPSPPSPRPPRVRNEITAMLVYSVNSVEVELLLRKSVFCPTKLHRILAPCVTMLRRLKKIVIYTAWAVFLQILRDIAFVFLFLANPVMYSWWSISLEEKLPSVRNLYKNIEKVRLCSCRHGKLLAARTPIRYATLHFRRSARTATSLRYSNLFLN